MNDHNRLAQIDPSERILLLPHCLRPTEGCPGKYTREGLICGDCQLECSINHMRQAALRFGYKGVCIAPGGRLALKYIENTRPKGIVAVACEKELQEGVSAVAEQTSGGSIPEILVIPLSRDGCVDTQVNLEAALEKIALGCSPLFSQQPAVPVRGN